MRVFKYLNQKGAIEAILNGDTLLSCPKDFNDPFDSVFYINKKEKKKAFDLFVSFQVFMDFYKSFFKENKKPTINIIAAEIIKWRIGQIAEQTKKEQRYTAHGDLSFYIKHASKYLNINLDEMKIAFDSVFEDVMNDIRDSALISCFGLTNNSILMWSHYAEKHKGVCLEYEVDDCLYKIVDYKKKKPVFKLTKVMQLIFGNQFVESSINPDGDKYLFMFDPIIVKARDWKYEKEVRILLSKKAEDERLHLKEIDGIERFLFAMPPIKRIYLGCKADCDFREKISKIAGEMNIPVVKMVTSKEKYKIIEESL